MIKVGSEKSFQVMYLYAESRMKILMIGALSDEAVVRLEKENLMQLRGPVTSEKTP
jgi:hypothetical protein